MCERNEHLTVIFLPLHPWRSGKRPTMEDAHAIHLDLHATVHQSVVPLEGGVFVVFVRLLCLGFVCLFCLSVLCVCYIFCVLCMCVVRCACVFRVVVCAYVPPHSCCLLPNQVASTTTTSRRSWPAGWMRTCLEVSAGVPKNLPRAEV